MQNRNEVGTLKKYFAAAPGLSELIDPGNYSKA
jgi:hypothetical protein